MFDGHRDVTFPYIPVHLEYIAMEILKNAMRATVEESQNLQRSNHPPIRITIAKSDRDVTIRIRDEGGGIPIAS